MIPRIFILLLVGAVAFSAGGCKSKKKLAQEAAAQEYADKVAKAITELKAILDDDGTMPISEQERRLNNIKSQNLNDATVNDLIKQVEEKIAAQKAEQKRLEEEEKQKALADQNKYQYLDEYFMQIAKAGDTQAANAKIAETKKLFASPDAPVLIIISESDGVTDYDKPTTIEAYLNYLKDTGNYNNKVKDAELDEYGQIKTLELIKK
jgi:Fe2+ transport system protein B